MKAVLEEKPTFVLIAGDLLPHHDGFLAQLSWV